MMQRGRGACYRPALDQRAAAADFVVGCIVHDPRWDHQVEERDWLYATLIADPWSDLPRLRASDDRLMNVGDQSCDMSPWMPATRPYSSKSTLPSMPGLSNRSVLPSGAKVAERPRRVR